MREPENRDELFSVRERIRRWKSLSGFFHLLTVCGMVLSLLWIFPRLDQKSALRFTGDLRDREQQRQLLVEALDKIVRYEKYYSETYGRYTRDLSRLQLPARFAGGSREEIQSAYEISVPEAYPNRFLILATGINNGDRVMIDESHRLSANFILPPPSRAYLLEEADRLLKLRAQGVDPEPGIYSRYWKVESSEEGALVASGVKDPILGERREWKMEESPLFAAVSEQVKSRLGLESRRPSSIAHEEPTYPEKTIAPFHESVGARDVYEWLEAGRYAQQIFRREHGRFAQRWEQLDGVSDFHFAERMRNVKNVRVHPIELSADKSGFRLTLEGTDGALMGEQFVIDQAGTVRQVRYTEALIHQLQETTSILQNAFQFQINPVGDGSPAAHP